MTIDVSRLRNSLKAIQIIMICGSLVGATIASEGEEARENENRDSLKFSCMVSNQQSDSGSLTSSDNIFKNDSESLKSSGNIFEMEDVDNRSDETKDKNSESGSDQSPVVKGAEDSISLGEMLKSHTNEEVLSQPNIIQVLSSLREENAEFKKLIVSIQLKHIDAMQKVSNEREDYKTQLEQVTKRNTGLVTRDKKRTFNINIAYGVTSLFAVLYVLYEMIYYPSPYNAEKIDL